jgi:hypothetical protein
MEGTKMEAIMFLFGLAIICAIFFAVGFVAILKFLICFAAAAWLHEHVLWPLLNPKPLPQAPIGTFVRYVRDDDDDRPPPDEPEVVIPPPPPPGRALLPPKSPGRPGRHNSRTCRSLR